MAESRLRTARRLVRGSQAVLVGLAVVSGVIAARTEATDLETSNRWTVVMLAAIIALPLGGLVRWVPPGTPPALRKRERARTVGRWLRSVLASGGLASISVGIIVEQDGLALFGLLLLVLSPFVYLVYAAIGKRTVPAWERPAPVAPAPTAVATPVGELLVEPDGRTGPRSTVTIRPRATGTTPAGMDGWLRNGALSTDGTTLTVTDRSGRAHRLPLASVTELLVLREEFVAWTRYGWSAPRLREALCLVDTTGRRVMDIELYGWTRSDLVSFTRAAGLRLDRYAPTERQTAVPTLRGTTPTPFDRMVPRAPGHRKIRGRALWRDALLVTTVVVLTLALYAGGIVAVGTVDQALGLTEPWRTLLLFGMGVGMLMSLVALARRAANWHERRKQATRVRPYDAI